MAALLNFSLRLGVVSSCERRRRALAAIVAAEESAGFGDGALKSLSIIKMEFSHQNTNVT